MRENLATIGDIARTIVIVLGALIYIVSPLDLLPDVVPVLGWIDDAAIFVAGLASVLGLVERLGALKPTDKTNQ